MSTSGTTLDTAGRRESKRAKEPGRRGRADPSGGRQRADLPSGEPRTGSLPLLAGLLAVASLAWGACGGADADEASPPAERTRPAGAGTADESNPAGVRAQELRPGSGRVETVGTFHGVVDGDERTWYAVAGEVDGRTESSAVWIPLSDEERMVSLEGFDDPDVPIATFEFDLARGKVSTGDYEGSLLGIVFRFAPGDFETTVRAPDASVFYLPEVPEGDLDYASMYAMQEGVLDVVLIDVSDDGIGRFEGTFSGTLRTMDGGDSMEIADGRFEVERALRQEPADPPSAGGGG